MFLLVMGSKWRGLAHAKGLAQGSLAASTQTGTDWGASEGEYPRLALVYTIRTPSPDGQSKALRRRLPVFLGAGLAKDRAGEPGNRSHERRLYWQYSLKKGDRSCLSINSLWRSRSVRALQDAAIQSVSRLSAVPPSERGLPSSPMGTLARVRLWVLQAMWPIVSFTRVAANSLPAQIKDQHKPRRPAPARFFCASRFPFTIADTSQKDTPCSTRS